MSATGYTDGPIRIYLSFSIEHEAFVREVARVLHEQEIDTEQSGSVAPSRIDDLIEGVDAVVFFVGDSVGTLQRDESRGARWLHTPRILVQLGAAADHRGVTLLRLERLSPVLVTDTTPEQALACAREIVGRMGRPWRLSSSFASPVDQPHAVLALLREAAAEGRVVEHEAGSERGLGVPDALALPYPPAGARALQWLLGRRRAVMFGTVAAAGALAVVGSRWLGLFTLDVPRPEDRDIVDCTIFAPPVAVRGEPVLVQIFVHLPMQEEDARALATEFDTSATRRAVKGLETAVVRGHKLTFGLDLPGGVVEDPTQSLIWRGLPAAVQFSTRVPADSEARSLVGTVSVMQGSVPVGHISFKLDVVREPRPDAPGQLPVGDEARRYRSAFLSYASVDRSHVIRAAQLLRAMDIQCFQDILDLDPGERWGPRLYAEIEDSDLFLLFWSRAAKQSTWVRREAVFALGCRRSERGRPEIKPVVIERDPIDPWPELAELHFGDPLTYFLGDSAGP